MATTEHTPFDSFRADIAAALEAGMQLGAPKISGNGADQRAYAVVPYGSELQIIPEREAPARKSGTVIVRDLESLLAYCAPHRPEEAVLYLDAPTAKSPFGVAVLNEHASTPGFRDHRAVWPLDYSRQWLTWTKSDGRWMTQTEFGEFLEANLSDIEQPDGAQILEMALNFSVHRTASFVSQQVLRTGQTVLTYDEELAEGAGRDKMSLPGQIGLRLPIFQDRVAFQLGARLRYRLHERKLTLSYQLMAPLDAVDARLDDLAAQLRAQWPGTLVMGAPE